MARLHASVAELAHLAQSIRPAGAASVPDEMLSLVFDGVDGRIVQSGGMELAEQLVDENTVRIDRAEEILNLWKGSK